MTEEVSLEGAEGEVDLILFEIAGQLFGADASLVLRIERPSAEGKRALVFQGGAEEGQLPVDRVRGVKAVSVASLRRMPAAASQPHAIGVWLDGDDPVLLLDLVEFVKRKACA